MDKTIACDIARRRADDSATSRRSSCTRACAAASAGASPRGSSCDRAASSPAAAATSGRCSCNAWSTPATTCACSTSTTPTTGRPASSSCSGDIRDRDRRAPPRSTASTSCSTTSPRCRWPRTTRCCARVNVDGTVVLLDACAARRRRQGRAHVVERGVRRAGQSNPVLPTTVPSPVEAYGHAKLAAEWACLAAVARRARRHHRAAAHDPRSRPARHLRHPVRLDRRRRRRVRARRRVATATSSSTPTISPRLCVRAGEHAGPGDLQRRHRPLRHDARVAGVACAPTPAPASRVRSLPAGPAAAGDARRAPRCGSPPFAPYHWMMYAKSMWFDIDHARDAARLAAAVVERGDARRQLRLVPRQPRRRPPPAGGRTTARRPSRARSACSSERRACCPGDLTAGSNTVPQGRGVARNR